MKKESENFTCEKYRIISHFFILFLLFSFRECAFSYYSQSSDYIDKFQYMGVVPFTSLGGGGGLPFTYGAIIPQTSLDPILDGVRKVYVKSPIATFPVSSLVTFPNGQNLIIDTQYAATGQTIFSLVYDGMNTFTPPSPAPPPSYHLNFGDPLVGVRLKAASTTPLDITIELLSYNPITAIYEKCSLTQNIGQTMPTNGYIFSKYDMSSHCNLDDISQIRLSVTFSKTVGGSTLVLNIDDLSIVNLPPDFFTLKSLDQAWNICGGLYDNILQCDCNGHVTCDPGFVRKIDMSENIELQTSIPTSTLELFYNLNEINLSNQRSLTGFLSLKLDFGMNTIINLSNSGVNQLTIDGGIEEIPLLNIQNTPNLSLISGEYIVNIQIFKALGSSFTSCCGSTHAVAFPLLSHVGIFTVSSNPFLTSIEFPNLVSIGPINIFDNSLLNQIDFPQLEDILDSLFINNNPSLPVIDLSGVTTFSKTLTVPHFQLSIISNDILHFVDFSRLEIGEEEADMDISFNQQLTSVNFGLIDNVFQIQFRQNAISNLNLNTLTSVGGSFDIHSNQLESLYFPLLRTVLGNFDASFNGNLQIVDIPSNLEIGGNFMFVNDNVINNFDCNIKQVGGDFFLRNTKITELDLPMLEYVNGDLDLGSNANLISLSLPQLNMIPNTFNIHGATNLEQFLAPLLPGFPNGGLPSFGDFIRIVDLSSVTQLNDLNLDGRVSLRSFLIPKLENVGSIQFRNTSINDLNLPALISMTGRIDLSNNQYLSTVKINNLQMCDQIQITNTSLAIIEMQSLDTANSIILNDNKLTTVSFILLKYVGDFLLQNNSLTTFTIPLIGVTGSLNFANNSLGEFSLSTLSSVAGDVNFQGNQITSFNLLNLEHAGSLNFQNNQFTTIGGNNFDMLETVGSIDFSHNSYLVSVTFGELSTVSGDINFGGCTSMTTFIASNLQNIGSLNLNGLSLHTLDLSSLQSVSDSLQLQNNQLQEVDLSALTEAGHINLSNNGESLTVVELGALRYIRSGSLDLRNGMVEGILNLENLITVIGDLLCSDNIITSLDINTLQYVTGGIDFGNNNLQGTINFDNLEHASYINFDNNNLSNLNLPKLNYVLGDIRVSNNPSLRSIDASDLIQVVGNVVITSNPNLTTLNITSFLGDSSYSILLQDNALLTLEMKIESVNILNISNNAMDQLSLPSLKSYGSLIMEVKSVIEMPSLIQFNGPISFPPGTLQFVNFHSLTSVESIDLRDNQLTNIDFTSLTSVQGSIHLDGNQLDSINFGELGNVEGDISASDNPLMTSFSAPNLNSLINFNISNTNLDSIDLSSLESVVGDLILRNNKLTKLLLDSLRDIGGSVDLANNKLQDLDLPFITSIFDLFLQNNDLETINMEVLETAGSIDLSYNQVLSAEFPRLTITNNLLFDYNRNPLFASNPNLTLNFPILSSVYSLSMISTTFNKLSLPALTYTSSDILVTENDLLSSIYLPNLFSTRSLLFMNNNRLSSVSLFSLQYAISIDLSSTYLRRFILTQLRSLGPFAKISSPSHRSFDLSFDESFGERSLEERGIGSDEKRAIASGVLNLSNTPNLQHVSVNSLAYFVKLIIINSNVNLVELVSANSISEIAISNNPLLSLLSFPSLTSSGEISINNNTLLQNVSFSSPSMTISSSISISFNPSLIGIDENISEYGYPVNLNNNKLKEVPAFMMQPPTSIADVDMSNNQFYCDELPGWCSNPSAKCFPCLPRPISPPPPRNITSPDTQPIPSTPTFIPSPSPSMYLAGPDFFPSFSPLPSLPPFLPSPTSPPLPTRTLDSNEGGIVEENFEVVAPTGEDGQHGQPIVGYFVISDSSFNVYSSSGFVLMQLTDQSLVNSTDPENSFIVSYVVNITLHGDTSLNQLEICLQVPFDKRKNSCLAFIDESSQPPQWKCEDNCLKQVKNETTSLSYLCGKTSHLTSFAVLFEGLANGGKCGEGYDYVLGSANNDLILSASVAGFVILLALIILFLFGCTPLRKYTYGVEGRRAMKLRALRTSTPSTPLTVDAA